MHNQVLPSIESVDGSDPLETLQNPMARLEAKEEEDEDEDGAVRLGLRRDPSCQETLEYLSP